MPSEKGSEKPQEEDVTVPQVKDMKTRVRVVAFDRGRWGKLRIEGKASYKAEKWRQMKWEELRMLSGGWAGVAGCIILRSHTVI